MIDARNTSSLSIYFLSLWSVWLKIQQHLIIISWLYQDNHLSSSSFLHHRVINNESHSVGMTGCYVFAWNTASVNLNIGISWEGRGWHASGRAKNIYQAGSIGKGNKSDWYLTFHTYTWHQLILSISWYFPYIHVTSAGMVGTLSVNLYVVFVDINKCRGMGCKAVELVA